MKYAFAGDRQISCNLLKFIISKGFLPEALLVSNGKNATHSKELKSISGLKPDFIFEGQDFKTPENIQKLKGLELDYIIGIHFPYIIPKEVLDIPTVGFLNLHPAFLPYNKGWNTPSWAIIDQTVYGATLHFMSEKLDGGDIIHQKALKVESFDTANSLYQKVLNTEEEVFKEAFESIISLNLNKTKQLHNGTAYRKSDLQQIREFNLEDMVVIKDFLNKLRALTTNNTNETAYYKEGDKKIGVKVEFIELDTQ
ncbi:MAG: formyltransferase family protein [Flavobacteriaceae bacterium]